MMTNVVRAVLALVLLAYSLVAASMLASCYPLPTEPKASASKVHSGGVPGTTDIMVPCWADSTTAWIVNLPLCTAVGGAR